MLLVAVTLEIKHPFLFYIVSTVTVIALILMSCFSKEESERGKKCSCTYRQKEREREKKKSHQFPYFTFEALFNSHPSFTTSSPFYFESSSCISYPHAIENMKPPVDFFFFQSHWQSIIIFQGSITLSRKFGIAFHVSKTIPVSIGQS